MAQIYLFTGENSFQLREEKRRWIEEFVKKHGPDNVVRLDGQRLTVRDLLDEISTAPFIALKRLVVVEGVPKSTKEEIQMLSGQIHPDTILLFADPKVDKRTGGAKELLATAEVKQFAPLKGQMLSQWMTEYAAKRGGSIGSDARDLLIEIAGEDQEMLAGEIEKLLLASPGKSVDKSLVEEMAVPSAEGVVWRLTDLIAMGRREDALRYARRLTVRGGDAYGLWALLLSMLKNLLLVHALSAEGERDVKRIAEQTGVHFFAVRAILQHAQRAKRESLTKFTDWAAESDIALKTGTYRATEEAPQELLALIDRFILACP